ncbi:MAG: hypothetical protein R2830_04745 [Saprospiraceae bacterium]
MNLLDKLFGNNKNEVAPNIRFGRYTDAYHTQGQDEAFEAAVASFENDHFLPAYVAFFNYLKNDDEGNLHFWEKDGELFFEFYQGSKKVTGYANEKKIYAEAKVAKATSLHSGFMRRLLEENFELKYSRFSLSPDNDLTIIFDSYTMDGSPYKLYAALKELAIHADKHDDLLVDEFEALEIIDLNIKRELPDSEKEIKYNYIIGEIMAAFREIDEGKLNADQYPIAITYLLLSLCYKLDYLTKPEGYMMETLERAHRLAFAKDGKNAAQKNQLLRKELQKLLERPKEKFFKEMYEVSATFGITAPIDHQKVALIIDQELPNMKWYYEHGHERIALAIPGFIAGRCLFYFAVPKPDRDLLHLLLQILEADYFGKLGFVKLFDNGVLDEKGIKQSIRRVAQAYRKSYPRLNPDLKKLVFHSLPKFSESYLQMVRELDLSKSE